MRRSMRARAGGPEQESKPYTLMADGLQTHWWFGKFQSGRLCFAAKPVSGFFCVWSAMYCPHVRTFKPFYLGWSESGSQCLSSASSRHPVAAEVLLAYEDDCRHGRLCDGQHNGVQWAVRPGPAPTLRLLPAAQRSWTLINAAVAARSWDGRPRR